MLQKLPWQDKRFTAALGFPTALCLQYVLALPADSFAYSNSWLAAAVWVVYALAAAHITHGPDWPQTARRWLGAGAVYSLFFALALVLGAQLETAGGIAYTAWPRWLAVPVLGLAAAPCLAWLLARLEAGEKGAARAAAADRHGFIRIWLVLMLAWTVTLLAAWPGYFAYDAGSEYNMVASGEYSGHHPLAHVLLLGGAVHGLGEGVLGSANAGITVFVVVQMALLAALFAGVLCTLRRLGVRRRVCALGLAFLALFPTVTMFAVCTTKDVLFSAGVVLLTALLLFCARDPAAFWARRGSAVLFALASALVVLMRNNGMYAWAVFAVLFAIVYRRWWRRWLAALLAVPVLYLGVNAGLGALLHVRPGETREMLSVPMQQLARVYNLAPETFTEPERVWLLGLIEEEYLTDYRPKLADNVKNGFSDEVFNSDPRTFLHVWVKAGLRRPDLYIDAFLMNTYQYWYPDTCVDGYAPSGAFPYTAYFETHTESPGEAHSLIPPLAAFYHKVGLEFYVQKLPVIGTLFTPGFWLWGWLLAAVYLWVRGGRRQVFALLPMALVFGTVLLGPIALVRYVLYLYFGIPLLLALLIDGGRFLEPVSE